MEQRKRKDVVLEIKHFTMRELLDLCKEAGNPDPADIVIAIDTPAGPIGVASISTATIRNNATGEESRALVFGLAEEESKMVFAQDIQGYTVEVVQ